MHENKSAWTHKGKSKRITTGHETFILPFHCYYTSEHCFLPRPFNLFACPYLPMSLWCIECVWRIAHTATPSELIVVDLYYPDARTIQHRYIGWYSSFDLPSWTNGMPCGVHPLTLYDKILCVHQMLLHIYTWIVWLKFVTNWIPIDTIKLWNKLFKYWKQISKLKKKCIGGPTFSWSNKKDEESWQWEQQ